MNNTMKQDVLDMTLRCYREKMFAGTSGNLSVFDHETGYMYITPTSFPYEKMQMEDMGSLTGQGKSLFLANGMILMISTSMVLLK